MAFFREPVSVKNNAPTPSAAVVIGAAVVFALLAACTLPPVQLNVTTVPSLTTALALTTAGGRAPKKSLGGLFGVLVALVFLIPISGSGSDLAFFYWVFRPSSEHLSGSPCACLRMQPSSDRLRRSLQ